MVDSKPGCNYSTHKVSQIVSLQTSRVNVAHRLSHPRITRIHAN